MRLVRTDAGMLYVYIGRPAWAWYAWKFIALFFSLAWREYDPGYRLSIETAARISWISFGWPAYRNAMAAWRGGKSINQPTPADAGKERR